MESSGCTHKMNGKIKPTMQKYQKSMELCGIDYAQMFYMLAKCGGQMTSEELGTK